MEVPKPQYEVIYNKANITKEITSHLVGLTYTDRVQGEADEIDIEIEDSSRKWQNEWYPEKGGIITLKIGYENNLVDCGSFEVDEIQTRGSISGRFVSIRGISALVSAPFRTLRSFAWEKVTLKRIAEKIAERGKMKVLGTIEEININRATQYKETDLTFLQRISKEYGYIFNIKSGNIVFTNVGKLQSRASVLTIHEAELSDWDILDATDKSFRGVEQKFYSVEDNQVIEYSATEKAPDNVYTKNAELVQNGRVENVKQAEIKAKAAMQNAVNNTVTGNITLGSGTPLVLAGSNINLRDIGKMSGTFHIESSTHTFTRSGGYMTSAKVFKIG